MEFLFKDESEADLAYWYQTDKKTIKKIEALFKSMKASPFSGIGKPEALKYDLSGKWSRRINGKDRIIYSVENGTITIYSLRGHYSK
ncbi:MAG: Txe/YoeB family addiction module toxin [Dysgonamonadaceae bacterium]|jgi:toxin YoeB|nr:Txe/YoeB family addiction module toxin [Dysgonamonadaceae bacterium]